MIQLTLGEQKIYPTFSELMESSLNWVLLVMTCEQRPQVVRRVLLTNNLSTITGRVDEYLIEVVDDPNEANEFLAKVHFPHSGFWAYDAIEVDSTVSWDPVDPALKKIVEKGRIWVINETSSNGTHSVYS